MPSFVPTADLFRRFANVHIARKNVSLRGARVGVSSQNVKGEPGPRAREPLCGTDLWL